MDNLVDDRPLPFSLLVIFFEILVLEFVEAGRISKGNVDKVFHPRKIRAKAPEKMMVRKLLATFGGGFRQLLRGKVLIIGIPREDWGTLGKIRGSAPLGPPLNNPDPIS